MFIHTLTHKGHYTYSLAYLCYGACLASAAIRKSMHLKCVRLGVSNARIQGKAVVCVSVRRPAGNVEKKTKMTPRDGDHHIGKNSYSVNPSNFKRRKHVAIAKHI